MNKLKIREANIFELLKQGKNYTYMIQTTSMSRSKIEVSIERLRKHKAVGLYNRATGKFEVDPDFRYEIEPGKPINDKVLITSQPQHHTLIKGIPPELIDNVLRQYAEYPDQRNKIAKDNNISKLVVNAILLDRGVGS
ncbi:hypothetical protein OB236_38455 [Paenibacillus sp. WQ 127069]|uniref:Uncharacterized protein n=1 Tax=Paenibacillus baimaensis TaxID=2982185 RepID=A0ABT2UWI4_9BACL|nr:hypothetical protein [Paenibacillus sp. WQ 127069]MCU6798024.1 hypothetical protein [Paenibacillus sp. WQ 127069]